ncbi:MAG: M3 family metallopeptidase [Pseudomonadota bacterium]
MSNHNPLLSESNLPEFSSIGAEHVLPALKSTLTGCRTTIEQLVKEDSPTWANFAKIMEDLDEKVDRIWSPVSHLNGVKDSPELREAYQSGIQMLTKYHTEVAQNTELYQRYKAISERTDFDTLSAAQKKIVENNVRDFRLGGAELSGTDKERFAQINQTLSELANRFERNLLDATQGWQKLIADKETLDGLPASALAMIQQLAQEADQEGYLLTLQIPVYLAVMQHAQNRPLRQELYEAYSTRASELGKQPEFDNTKIIDEILALKHEKAQLLGFTNYAELSMVKKMADSPDAVFTFLADLVKYAKPMGLKELDELQTFAREQGFEGELAAWDLSFYSERLREQRYQFTDEEVKTYFPAPKVINGMFAICRRLFGITIEESQGVQVWHDSVQYFDVKDQHGVTIGGLYTDIYVRKGKRGGAWMDTCVHRRALDDKLQLPVAYLTCNFSPPVGNQPALLTHGEVETLFHEFGHTLHHLLTRVDEMGVAGINGVAWDAVELPSQFLENWCWHPESLALIAGHVDSDEPLPAELLNKMRSAKNFQSGMQTLRQVEFALFDLEIHSQDPQGLDVQAKLNQVRSEVAVTFPPASNRFQNGFGHIFSGGYAAGYYSYKWAEVLSADAFGAFIEEGIFNAETGARFRTTILERGGVIDAQHLFEDFRSRPPKIEPLLEQTGIL